MNHQHMRLFAFLLLLFMIATLPAVVIKIGSIAPDGSIWGKALNDLAAECGKISGGAVQLKIYPGGIVGGETDMLTKMRLGTLGGAIFTVMGMTAIDGDTFVLNTPFLMNSDPEFNFVFDRMKPVFEKRIEAKGFKVLLWTLVGWEYFFSKDAVLYPEEMKKQKLSFTTVGPELAHAWKKMGYQIIPNDLKDLLMALQSGLVTAFYLPPLVAGTGQFFALAPHMLDLRLAPIVGALVLTDRAWKSIPEPFREPMIKAIDRISTSLYRQTERLEGDVLKTMKENGLIIHEPPADAPEKWRAAASAGMADLEGKAFSREIYEQILALLREYKQKNGK
jgi:TRAP-type C4-dicarboxylate transport system substrate-binding protein